MLAHQTLGSVCAQATVHCPHDTLYLPGLHLLGLTGQVTSAVPCKQPQPSRWQ